MTLRGPLYEYIEYVSNAETLWHKLQSGHWDWIGVNQRGQFIVGRPSLNLEERMIGTPSVVGVAPGARKGRHGIAISKWTGSPSSPSYHWFEDEAQARTVYEEQVKRLDTPEQTPILARVTLIVNGFPADERFIVPTPPTNVQ